MIFNVSGGGGTALNFRVVGGTEAPANLAKNCIWVNTEVDITCWIFSAEKPSPAEPGMVWFKVAASSCVPFNALKKNGVMVYPLSAEQYVDGAWVSVTAKTWQGSAWVDWWNGELYANGNEFESVTGGWYGLSWKMTSAVTAAETINIDREDSYIKMYFDSSKTRRSGFLLPTNKIDLTEFDTLTFAGGIYPNGTGSAAYGYVYILENLEGANANASYVSRADIANSGISSEVSIDVSGLSGEYYIAVCMYNFDTPNAYLVMNSMILS